MKNERNRCQNCKFREDYGGGDSYCKKTGFGYRAEKYDCENFVDRENHIRESTEVNYQVNVPEDATNGDVIKAMFPKAEIILNPYTASVDIFFGGILMMRATMKWWNTKYKKER